MDPISMIGLASTILRTTGLGEKVGEWIGGDKGEKAAKKVLEVAQVATGSASASEASAIISADPKVAAQVKKDLLTHQAQILQLRFQDLRDAREMQEAAAQSEDPFVRRFSLYLACFWSFIGASYMFCITFLPIPEGGQRFADTALGFILGTIIAQILSFFFGSSAGSAAKAKTIDSQLAKLFRN